MTECGDPTVQKYIKHKKSPSLVRPIPLPYVKLQTVVTKQKKGETSWWQNGSAGVNRGKDVVVRTQIMSVALCWVWLYPP